MINWREVKNFKPSEFSEDPDIYAADALIYDLDRFRNMLGVSIMPSPVKGALAREDGSRTSQHYVGLDHFRRSTAIDVFIKEDPKKVFISALQFGWKGIGVYFDTKYSNKKWTMFHLDTRSVFAYWFRVAGDYKHPMNLTGDRSEFFNLLAKEVL